jgi:hypothetical protein
VDIEEDMQIMGIRWWRKQCKKEQNGRESLRRLKSAVGCNVSKRRKKKYFYHLMDFHFWFLCSQKLSCSVCI